MLGSTHGTPTTGFRARVVACGKEPHAAVVSLPTASDRGGLDVSGRPLHLTVPDLDRFFRPRSVAVVGASDAEGRPNAGITRQLIAWAERVGARLHPVHQARPTVFGRACFPSVAEVPGPADLAVLLVADPLPVIEEPGEAKVPFAVAFASGFAETGEAGAAAQDRLAAGPTRALALTKQLVNASLDGDRATAFAAEAAAQEINMATRDAGEGVASFVERRTPSYRGH